MKTPSRHVWTGKFDSSEEKNCSRNLPLTLSYSSSAPNSFTSDCCSLINLHWTPVFPPPLSVCTLGVLLLRAFFLLCIVTLLSNHVLFRQAGSVQEEGSFGLLHRIIRGNWFNGSMTETHCGIFATNPSSLVCIHGKWVSTQKFQLAPLTFCLDTLAHNSCIFLGDLNSSWHSSPSSFLTVPVPVERTNPAVFRTEG